MKKTFKKLFATLLVTTVVLAGYILVQANSSVTVSNQYSGSYVKTTNIAIDYTEKDKISNSYAGKVIPIVVNEPGYLEVKVNIVKLQDDITFGLYKNAECTDYLKSIKSYNANDTEGVEKHIEITQSGTYYLKAETYVNSYNTVSFRNTCNVSVALYNLKDKTIKNNQVVYYCNESSNNPFYFKYKATKTGMLTVTHSDNSYGYVTLMDSKKKALTKEEYVSSYGSMSVSFAVKKGTTYYIKTDARVYDAKIGITVKEKAVKEKSGKNKKKAVNIKKNKKANGLIIAGEKKADWYKLKLNKKKKLTISYGVLGTGKFKITVYTSKGKKICSYDTYAGSSYDIKITNSTTYGKANKGTYYIKMVRTDKNCSGSYWVKWK